MNQKIGNACIFLVSFISLGFGLIYLFKDSFMPYHSQAVEMSWNDVDPPFQYLVLALMRAVAGGSIACAIVLIVLQRKFSNEKLPWIPKLILVTGLTLNLTSIYATLIVQSNTSGKPPTILLMVIAAILVIGYVFNQRALREPSNS